MNTYKDIMNHAFSKITEVPLSEFSKNIQPIASEPYFLKITSDVFSHEDVAEFLKALVGADVILEEDLEFVSPSMLMKISHHIVKRIHETT